jgi:cell division septation protein DedD
VDSQFKQRVTGAVILVLLAVLLVPELLTGPKSRPSGPTSSATTQAQGDGAPLRSYDIDLSDTPQAAPPAAPPAVPSRPEAAAQRDPA